MSDRERVANDGELEDEPEVVDEVDEADGAAAADPALEELLAYLRDQRGFDFTGYKRPSLTRRIRKRMQDVGATDFGAYLGLLESQPDEFAALFDTILINVTSFRRDPDAWDFLEESVIPTIIEASAGGSIRCWSAGCASGEEPYTLAVLLCRALGEEQFKDRVKIYATDADNEALADARAGAYPVDRLERVFGEDDVRQFFEATDGKATLRNDLRRSIIFGRHDLVQDPPISRVDLLVCRNTLMYLTADLQRRILGSFHFALRDGGFLFLGKSEALVTRTNLFRPVDLKSHIFVKNGGVSPRRPVLPAPIPTTARVLADGDARALLEPAFEAHPFAQLVLDNDENLVLANRQARTLFGLGTAQLRRPLRDLDLSYRPLEMRSLLAQVLSEGRPVLVRDVEAMTPGAVREWFDVHIVAIGTASRAAGAVVTYLPVGQYKQLREELERSQRELETAYEELQSVVEELETTNEELQSTNEELETINEELHSTNEELETMNEELQSTNEELETLNAELRDRTGDLHSINAFLQAVLRSLKAGVTVLNRDLVVQAWNKQCEELWGLRADEVTGQHFLNLDIGLPVDQLRQPMRDSLTGTAPESEVDLDAINRRGQSVRVHVAVSPLLAEGDSTEGVMLVMTVT